MLINKNIDKIIKKEDKNSIIDISDTYQNEYNFDNDNNILKSFSKIYDEYDITYELRPNTKFIRIRYLLRKLKENNEVPRNLYNYFHANITENNKLYYRIPIYIEEEEQQQQKESSINNIVINDKDLDIGILRVRYLSNRKLTNKLLKDDYKISKNMINAIKYNKDIHKLSQNEMKIYHELHKFLNKEQDINVLIRSYLSGNNSKKLYDKISSILYYKLENGILSKKEYTKLINKINKKEYYMGYILTSNQHRIRNNCIRYTFQKPIRFEDQYLSLTSIIFYNYFENVSDKFELTIKNKTQSLTINFKNGSYYTNAISLIINDDIKKNFNDVAEKEKHIEIVMDVNRYIILIVVKDDWEFHLDKNLMGLFGFERSIIIPGYHRSSKIPNIDKTKFLKIHCNLVNNKEDDQFLTNVFIKNDISDQVTYENLNNYKRKRVLDTTFDYIEICIKDKDNENVIMKDFFQICFYISEKYMMLLEKLFNETLLQLKDESKKDKKLKICK